MSKIFGRNFFKQVNVYIELFLSTLLTGVRKKHNMEHPEMLEKWKDTLDKGSSVATIFMNVSKAFDTLNLDLLITEL